MSSTCDRTPAGSLDQAVDVTDAFLEGGEVVSQRGRDKNDIERYYARPGDLAHGLPVIVLIDAGQRLRRRKSSPERCRIIAARWSWAKRASARARVQTVVQTGAAGALCA